MRPSTAPAARRQPGTGLLYLISSGLLWGTGGLTGSLLSRVAVRDAGGRLPADRRRRADRGLPHRDRPELARLAGPPGPVSP